MRTRYTIAVALLVASLLLLPAVTAGNMPLPSSEVTASITARDLRGHLNFLASDELGGRYSLSPSIRIVARYLAARLEAYGYRGGARGGLFLQRVPLVFQSIDLQVSKLKITAGSVKVEFKYGEDFLFDSTGDVSFGGPLLWVGDAESSNGLDLNGKIAVVPMEPDRRTEAAALKRGAAGVIAIPTAAYLRTWDIPASAALAKTVSLPGRQGAHKAGHTLTAGPRLTRWIAAAIGKDVKYLTSGAGKPRPAEAIDASAEVRVRIETKDTPPAHNVVGVLEGADPKLRDEYVVFSAHYDHLSTEAGGRVYNGADDDGSGTAAVLEIAEAFAIGPRPKRSILIVFHTAEEIGLFGSEFNTDYEPVVPLSNLVADFNIDMIGRSRSPNDTDPKDAALSDKNTLYLIGADRLSSELFRISEQTNAETTRLRLDHTLSQESHPERLYYRSDHYNYAKHGVPVIFYFTGLHRDYHQPTDDIDKIDFDKMERITRLIFATGWRVANLDHRLVVDKPVPR